MQMGTKWLLAGAGVALLALLGWAFAPRPVKVDLAEVRTGLFEAGIEEDGKTQVVQRYQVAAPLAGRWLRPTLEAGDAVQAGQVMGQIEASLAPLRDARSRAELAAQAEAAEAALGRAQARLAAAAAALALAQKQEQRSAALGAQGFVAGAQHEDAALALKAAEAEQRSAQAERHMAQHALEQAQAALGAVQAGAARGRVDAFELRAPVAGQVLRMHQPSETLVALGTPLIELGDLAQLEVVAELLSTDALQIQPGQPVRIERWGGPAVLQGRVLRVEPGAFTKVSALGVEEQRVRVQIGLVSPPEQRRGLGDGYRVGVRVLTQQRPDVPLVPVSAVFPLPGAAAGRHAVFRFEGGRAQLREVKLAGRNEREAWIGEGLKPGDRVIVYPPQGLLDGARVKPR
ncbi:MAG: HlyD family efflux transporter periplasmic adaptor subunit [Inhella sp.]